jgi:amino acid transporter
MSKKKIEVFVADTVKYFLSFVALIAVVYFIYAGFQLMVSGGDEEKAKKTRRIMTYVIAGIILIWVSYFLVAIVINSLT